MPVIEEPIIYGGLLFRHFGHAISESIHRLWPRFAMKELASARIAFHLVNNTKVMPYVTEAFNLHGIPRRHILGIDQPMLFRHLFVGPQARQMAGPTIIPNYRSMLDHSLGRRLPPPGGTRRLYVSRMYHHHTGSFYGESFVEKQLAACGFEIIYPEQHRLTALVEILRDSELAVFAEGSAIHALELCGSVTPAAFVIGRRGMSTERFTPLLSNICQKWKISDHLLANLGMSADKKKHSGLIRLSAVMRDLQEFSGIAAIGSFTPDQLSDAIRMDLEHHIGDERNERDADYARRASEMADIALTREPF
nr:glycosyltransferase 61 family protein [Sphingomonas caseinilyticus]